MASLTDRMLRAARLDANLYEEVEADTTAMGQATTVVILSSLAGGIGTSTLTGALGASAATGIGALLGGAIASLIGWYVWAFLTYYIGTKWLPEPTTEADTGQMLRTLGFASAPGLIRLGGLIPGVGVIALVAAPIWMFCAMVVAVRQALDYSSTGRAVVVCLIGFVVQTVVIVVLLVGFSLLAAAQPGLPTA